MSHSHTRAPMTEAEKVVRQHSMYGCSEADMREAIEDALKMSDAGMIVMSLLSDSQEEIAMGLQESARQTINRAKWVISTYIRNAR